nr:glycosyltransferase family 2 protein [uncultured Rhodoferax sp.]
MKISIVTCTWNSEPYLAASIDSVLKQTYPHIEYVFVDGGSTDGTLERIAALPVKTTILHGVRGGIAHAMNEGWKVATGEVIAHLHSDDYYLHAHVLSQVAGAMSNGAGWAFGRIVRDIAGQQVPESYLAPAYSRRRLLRGNFIPHPATFVRKDWFEQTDGFDESLKYAMDYDLWLRLAKLGAPIEISGALAAFREHAGSLSTQNRLAALSEDYLVRKNHAGHNPLIRFENLVRFWVRQRRMVQKTQRDESTEKEST